MNKDTTRGICKNILKYSRVLRQHRLAGKHDGFTIEKK